MTRNNNDIPMVEIRTDEHITTQDDTVVTPADARRLHEWPSELISGNDTVTVAVMDSGISEKAVQNNSWFDGVSVTKRYDAVGNNPGVDYVGHGTGCASIISKNAVDVELYDVRIFGKEGRTGWSAIRDAYTWLIDHADEIDVVNMSWGARKDVPQINQLHEKLVKRGVHDVVAAGNTGAEGGSPSTSPKAFSAGAVDENGDLTRFTSRDPNQDNPDVAVIGKDVKMARVHGTSMGTPINDQFVKASGTSFSAPYTVAAYANALHRKKQSWDSTFEKAAPDIPGTKADGEGLLKVKPSFKKSSPESPNPTANGSVWSLFYGDTLLMEADWLPDGDTVVEKVGETKDSVTIEVKK